jgi:hypothetical protein
LLSSGDTFLIPERTDGTEHLYVVLTDPEPGSNRAVCVNFTGKTVYSDTTLVLNVGDHPFITKETVVFYQRAKFLNLSAVEAALNAHTNGIVCKPHDPCDGPLLERIRDGLLRSKLTPKDIKRYCEAAWRVAPAAPERAVPVPTRLNPPIRPVSPRPTQA